MRQARSFVMNVLRRLLSCVSFIAFAVSAQAEVVSNCFSVVGYGDDCTHLVCELEKFAGMEFVLDRTEVNHERRWSFGPHHTKGWSYAAVVMPGDMISYLNFQGRQGSVDLNPAGEMYCAFAWNDPKPVGDTQDFLGWFHLREVEGRITIVSCAVETQRGYRMVVAPGDPVDWFTWIDPKTLISWRYKVYGDVCGIGCGKVGRAGVDFPGNTGSMGQVAIPANIKGLPVVKIESYAFLGCNIEELYIPGSVTNIAAFSFKDGHVSAMYFEGNAPKAEDHGFDGLDAHCMVYPKLDADGWPNNIVWQGLRLEYKSEIVERKDEFERERVDAEGVCWHDDVEVAERICRDPRKWGESWYLLEEVYCETNIVTRRKDAPNATGFVSLQSKVHSETSYHDLCHKKSVSFDSSRFERDEDMHWTSTRSQGGNSYTAEGVPEYEFEHLTWETDTPDLDGVVYRVEDIERHYSSGRLVRLRHDTESTRQDDTTFKRYDYVLTTWDNVGNIAKTTQTINEVDDNGFWRETWIEKDYCYQNPYDGQLAYVAESVQVKEPDGYRWRKTRDDYDKEGVRYSGSCSSGTSPDGFAGGLSVGIGPGGSVDVNAKSEEDALGKVVYDNFTVVEGGVALPVPMEVYFGYFKATATQVGEDLWRVAYDVDPDAVGLAESVADIGPQLGAVASGNVKTITISAKPGLYYGIATAESPLGPFVCPRKTYAWGETVELSAPEPNPSLFMRVVVGVKD